MSWEAPFPESMLRIAISESVCWADALRRLGYEVKGANYRTLQRWARNWGISTEHFDPNIGRARAGKSRQKSLAEVMVDDSGYSRGTLKERLLAEGIKQRACEMCGQGDLWRGQALSLVLDHINGVSNDHRLENLRILCPNCNATLDTHCGRKLPRERTCPSCHELFAPKHIRHRYCSPTCWGVEARERYTGTVHPETRKVERPSHEQLLADVAEMSMVAVGRKYGVSDNAVRKWLRWYDHSRQEPALRSAA